MYDSSYGAYVAACDEYADLPVSNFTVLAVTLALMYAAQLHIPQPAARGGHHVQCALAGQHQLLPQQLLRSAQHCHTSRGFKSLQAAPQAQRRRTRSAAAKPTMWLTGYTQDDVPDLTGKLAIITGSTSGLGYEIAKAMAEKNADLIIASRDQGKCERVAAELGRLGTGDVQALQLDLSSFRSIKDFTDKFLAMNRPLHRLVCNAGVFLVPFDRTQEGFEVTWGTNYAGHFLLTHYLLPKLTETANGRVSGARVAFMSSTFEQLGWVDWDDLPMYKSRVSGLFEYANSKIEVLMLSRELQKRMQGTGVEFFAAQPGLVSSPLYSKGDHSYASMWTVELGQFVYGQSPYRGCRSLLRAATDPELDGKGGWYFSPPYFGLLPIHYFNGTRWFPFHYLSRDQHAWQRLYDSTMQIVNQKLQDKRLPTIEAAGGQQASLR